MKRAVEYAKTFEVGRDPEGRQVFVEVELQKHGPEFTIGGVDALGRDVPPHIIERQTVTHGKVTEWVELSISGIVQGGSVGQIRDALDTLRTFTMPKDQVKEIASIWDRWHLNGMKAACVHQPEEWACPKCGTVNGWHLKPVYPKRGAACTKCSLDRWDAGACPEGYRYGTAWLLDPLPEEIIEKVKAWGQGQSQRNPYGEQARDFLRTFGLEIKRAFKGDRCPPYCDGTCVHGDRYRVTVRRIHETPHSFGGSTSRSISFDFWNSQTEMQKGGRPSAYSILACISSEAFAPTDPDEVVREFGEMKPSQANAVARFARKLQAFFTEEELEALSEIR